MNSPIVVIDSLKKSYGSIVALKNISLTIEKGEIFGLLGPNGSGKTTTIRCLCTLAKPDQGKIEVKGVSALEDPKTVRNRLGYVAQEVAIDKMLTGRELLELQAALYHLPKKAAKARIEQLLSLLDLEEYSDRKTGTYSGGIRKRLDLAAGLLHQPDLLVLDEPTVGLDIGSRQMILKHVKSLCKKGDLAVLWATHLIDEIDKGEKVVIIDKGEIVESGDVLKIVKKTKQKNIRDAFNKLVGVKV